MTSQVTAEPVFSEVGPNIDVTMYNDPGKHQQMDPTIAIDPTNPNIIVTGGYDRRGATEVNDRLWHGYCRSTDGGQTWTVSLLPGFPTDDSSEGLASPLHGYGFTGDPILAFDNLGNVFYAGMAINITARKFVGHIFVAKYTNHGATYDSTTMVFSEGFNDNPEIAVDTTGGPNNGNVYITWATNAPGLAHAAASIVFSRSTDHGVSFSGPVNVMMPPFVPYGGSSRIAVAPDGHVFVSWIGRTVLMEHAPAFIMFAKSVDAGQTFDAAKKVQRISQILGSLLGSRFRVYTQDAIAADENGVYIIWDDVGTGDADVLLIKSTNDGETWSAPTRVNDVATNNQFFPSISVSGGNIHVIFYDSRNDPNGKLLDVYYAQSIDGGETFLPNVKVTEISFDPNVVTRFDSGGFIFIGDYIQVASTPVDVHAIWTDNRNVDLNADLNNGRLDQDIFTAKITDSNG
jgi:hypothetical protein